MDSASAPLRRDQPAERFIEAASAPLAESNAELHLAAQHVLKERTDRSDPARLDEAANRLSHRRKDRWISALLIVMGLVSLSIIAMGSKHYRDFRQTRQLLSFDGSDPDPVKSPHLTPDQRLLLYGDTTRTDDTERWKALWQSRPDHPPYFVDYAFRSINEHEALPPGFLKDANEIDPDNGIYLAAAAAIESEGSLSEGSTSGFKREDRKARSYDIDDPEKHAESLNLFRQAMGKPRFTFYSEELLKERIPLLPERKDFASQIPAIAYVAGGPAHFFEIHQLNETLSAEIQRCAAEGDLEGYRSIKKLSHGYFERIAADGNTLVETLIAKAHMVQGVRNLRDAAGELGLDDEREAFHQIDLTLKPPEKERGYQGPVEEEKTEKLIERHGGIFHTLSMPMIHKQAQNPVPITANDLTPGRRTEHALLGRMAALTIWLILGAALAIAAIYRQRHGTLTSLLAGRCRDLLGPSDWMWILGLGVLAPILWYLIIGQLSPLAAHHWSMRLSAFAQPAGQITATGWLLIITSIVVTRWRLSKRAPIADMRVRLPWVGWLAVTAVALSIPILGMMFLVEAQAQNILLLGGSLLIFGQLWLLVVALRALFGKARQSLFRQSVARCLIPAYACGMILTILSVPIFHHQEKKWIKQDWIFEISTEEPSMGRYEYRVARQLQAELAEVLADFPE